MGVDGVGLKPHLLSQQGLRRMAYLSEFVGGALAGLAKHAASAVYPSRRGFDEKAGG